jgi:hypothetical protein
MRNSYSYPGVGVGTNRVQAPSSTVDVIVRFGAMEHGAGMRLAMNSVHGWFSDNKEWIEFITATLLLWLLMMTAINELDLRSVS